MADVILTGEVAVYGIEGGVALMGAAVTVNQPKAAGVTNKADRKELKNGRNRVTGRAYSNFQQDMTFDFTPVDATGSLSLAKAATLCPMPGAKVTASGFGLPDLDGEWVVDEASMKPSVDDYVIISLKCNRVATGVSWQGSPTYAPAASAWSGLVGTTATL